VDLPDNITNVMTLVTSTGLAPLILVCNELQAFRCKIIIGKFTPVSFLNTLHTDIRTTYVIVFYTMFRNLNNKIRLLLRV
jgi:hypothetical protein